MMLSKNLNPLGFDTLWYIIAMSSSPDRSEGTRPMEFPFTDSDVKAKACEIFGYNPKHISNGLHNAFNPKYRFVSESSEDYVNNKRYWIKTFKAFDGETLVAEFAEYTSQRTSRGYNIPRISYALDGKDHGGRRIRVSVREHTESLPKLAAQIERDPQIGLEFAHQEELSEIASVLGLK